MSVAAAGARCRERGSRSGRARVYATSVRVLLADPPPSRPGTTTSSQRRSRGQVPTSTLATSRFRFGELPEPDGYRRSERFYPLSSRLFGRSRLRLPLKAVEHLDVMRSLARARPDVLHLQWLALPQADVHLRFRAPAVFTAHDLFPRRTASRRDLWRRLLARFDRVVVHSERGRATLAELGVDARVIPHPVYPSERREGTTAQRCSRSASSVPTRGCRTRSRRRGGCRKLGWSSRVTPRCRSTACATRSVSSGGSATCRRRSSTARFRKRPSRSSRTAPSSTSPARSSRRSAPASRRLSTTSAGSASRCSAYGAGRVVPAGDVDALTAAVRELLDDREALAARGPARSAPASELTWDAAAERHLELYRELG